MWAAHPCVILARVGEQHGKDSHFGFVAGDYTRTFTTQCSWNPTLAQTLRGGCDAGRGLACVSVSKEALWKQWLLCNYAEDDRDPDAEENRG